MTNSIVSVSQTDLAQRRQKLRQRRRVRVLQTSWRLIALSGLAGGLVWVATSPAWVIRQPEQVKVEGNRYLSTQAIRAQLPIPYPQFLLRVEPRAVAEGLKARIPVADVAVSRQLLPPGLTVQVKERYPVAIALPATADRADSTNAKTDSTGANLGLLDASGVWMPLERYTSLDQSIKLPELKVIGNPEQYRPHWPRLYQAINSSPIRISEIDWRDPTNLRLKTELGTVHFGPYSQQFSYQLKTLDKMRKLPTRVQANRVSYIDLKNPEDPTIQMQNSKDPVKSDSSSL